MYGILFFLALAASAGTTDLHAQDTVSVSVRVLQDNAPVVAARVSAGSVVALTDTAGATLLRLAAGRHVLRVESPGAQSYERALDVTAGRDTAITVVLRREVVEHEAIIVASTRADRRIEDEPLRVEVVTREEIEEKLLMTPGDIAMLLNETAGLRVQPTSAALGGAGVRIQGLRGRYTQILSDGLPLYGGQTGALGPLQIPPMDLGQVEVIKGVASALYGASALGGVVNLISLRPADEREREVLLNQSTLGGTDAILWLSDELGERWGYTLLTGAHRQTAADADDDGWYDVPSYTRGTIRPRIFRDDGRGGSLLLTAGVMVEDRSGGMDARRSPITTSSAHASSWPATSWQAASSSATSSSAASSHYRESLATTRADAGMLARTLLDGARLLNVRASAAVQRHEHGFGTVIERDVHGTGFAELSLAGARGAHTWVAGAAVQHERYRADDVTGFDYTFTVPGVFVQDEIAAADWLTLAASARLDHHSRYGSFVNPRVSLLLRPADDWTVRASGGTGFFAPTPWTEETEAVGLHRVAGWTALEPERARSGSLDIGRELGPVELNATLFGSVIRDPVQVRRSTTAAGATVLELFNAGDAVHTRGTELLARYHREGVHVTATHVFLRSTEPDPATGARREVPLTPRHTVGLVGALEQEERGRIGVEFYYTGRQQLDDNPYRTASVPHVIVGFLIERHIGAARVFLNAENVFDTRQTRHDPLTLPARAPDGRWTTDVWAPLEGRSFNAGVRLAF
jgi:outer membrane receptor for ferrienterochelin and colicins